VELFGHSAHHEPDVAASKTPQPTAHPQQVPRAKPTSVPVASSSAAPAPTAPAPAEQAEGHWSKAIERTRSVAAISKISRTFDHLKRAFSFPGGPLTAVPGAETPRLAYNPTNAPIHAYEHALSELFTSLDAVDSFGFRGVREFRKEVVVKIEKELEALEKKVAEAIAAGASPVVKSTEVVLEEPAAENRAKDKVAEDIVMEEAEVAAVVAANDAEETIEGYDLDTDDTATVVPAPAPTSAPVVESTLVADSPMVDPEAHPVTVEVDRAEVDAITFDVTPAGPTTVEPSAAQPEENPVEGEYQQVDPDHIIIEPVVEPEPASQTTESISPAEVITSKVAVNPTSELASQTVLGDATSSSSEADSEIEDAIDVTVSSDSDAEVKIEADSDGAVSDMEKDFEML